MNTNKF